MTPETTINARAGAVAEILIDRHADHEYLHMAINRTRNAVLAGLSAHAALERGEQCIRDAEIGTQRTSIVELLFAIPATKPRNVQATPDGYRGDLVDHHTGRRVEVRIIDKGRN